MSDMYTKLKMMSPGKLVIVACIISMFLNVILGLFCNSMPASCQMFTALIGIINLFFCAFIIIRMFECGDKTVKIL